MDETLWRQVTVAYPGSSHRERERNAVSHLRGILPEAETAGLVTAWWFIRKGPWRIRYLPSQSDHGSGTVRRLLTDGVTWTNDIYEPETHAFGGPAAMDATHTLFHQDSRHLLDYLHNHPNDRREQSLILCTTLMRAAGLDLDEQGDVWARVEEARAHLLRWPPAPNQGTWAAFTDNVRQLLLGTVRTTSGWHTAFEDAGAAIRTARETGGLTRGMRAVIAKQVIFHWNRIGLPAAVQATLAHAARDAIFGAAPTLPRVGRMTKF